MSDEMEPDIGDKSLFDTTNKVLFSLFGIIIGFFLYTRIMAIMDSYKVDTWPPEIDVCPNMWVKKGKKCDNVLGLRNKRCHGAHDLRTLRDPRSKCRMAKYTCNVDWDGYDKLC